MLKGDAEQGSSAGVSRRQQLLEVCVFLFLIIPSMIISLFMAGGGRISFPVAALSILLRDLALVSLILFFLWRNGERIEAIGWRRVNAGREALLGALLFLPFSFGAGALETVLHKMGFSSPPGPLPALTPEKSTAEFLLAAVLVIVVALAEETIFRGYLMLRFRNISSNTAAALFGSAFIFSLGHGYEGSAGVVTVGVMGLVFALVYRWRGNLIAPAVIHFLQDFIGIVLVPLLGIR